MNEILNLILNIKCIVLILRKGICPYEYMDNWSKFYGLSLPNKERLYLNLNFEDIIEPDYEHARNVWSSFKVMFRAILFC